MQLNKAEIIVPDSNSDFATLAGNIILNQLQTLADQPSVISLSGGNTPLPVYEIIGKRLHGEVLAENFCFIQTDERNVAHSSPRSNQRAILNSLFKQHGLPLKRFSMIRPGNHDFENTFNATLPGLPAALMPPHPIDLVILGMGADGHTASLFPGTDWQNSHSRTGYRVFSPKNQPEQRISLTLERILQARHLVFLISGTDKVEALTRVLLEHDRNLPAGFIVAERTTTWILSSETAASWQEFHELTLRQAKA